MTRILKRRRNQHIGDLCIRFPSSCSGASPVSNNSESAEDIAASSVEDAGFGVRDAASIGVGLAPIVGSIQSGIELIFGHDYMSGEPTSRWLAGVGILAGILPGGKALLKGASKAGKLVDLGSAASKALKGGHYTDFADEASDMMEDAARSRGLTPNANIVNMARKDDIKAIDEG